MVTKLSGHEDSEVQRNVMTSLCNNHYSTAYLNLGPTSNSFAQNSRISGKSLAKMPKQKIHLLGKCFSVHFSLLSELQYWNYCTVVLCRGLTMNNLQLLFSAHPSSFSSNGPRLHAKLLCQKEVRKYQIGEIERRYSPNDFWSSKGMYMSQLYINF